MEEEGIEPAPAHQQAGSQPEGERGNRNQTFAPGIQISFLFHERPRIQLWFQQAITTTIKSLSCHLLVNVGVQGGVRGVEVDGRIRESGFEVGQSCNVVAERTKNTKKNGKGICVLKKITLALMLSMWAGCFQDSQISWTHAII